MHVELVALALCAWLLTYALHSTLLIAAAWMSSAVLAHIGRVPGSLAVVRERLWKLALVGGIATATVQTALGGGPWSLVAESPVAETATPSESTAALPASSDSVPYVAPVFLDPASFQRSLESIRRESRAPRAHGAALGVSNATPALLRSVPDVRAALPAAPDAGTREPTALHTLALSRTWIRGLLVVWIVGVLFGIARWALDWRRLGAALRGRTPIVRGPAREVFDTLVKRTGLGARVRLLHAPRITAPITIGFWRPAICLPPRAESELQRDELEALLAHELAHALRRDPAWLCACRAIEVLLFFQPLNRLARVQLADEAEYLCDDWAVRHTRERLSLASCLTEIAGWIVGRPLDLGAPGMAARGSRLELRVRRVLERGEQRGASDAAGSKAPRWLSPVACGAVGAVALFVPGVSAKGVSDEADFLAREDRASESQESPESDARFTTLGPTPTVAPADDASPIADRSEKKEGADEASLLALELQAFAANPFFPRSRVFPQSRDASEGTRTLTPAPASTAPEAASQAASAPAEMLRPAAPRNLDAETLADAQAFEADIAALEESLRALKTELSRRQAPPEFSRRMKALEAELRTLQERRGELLLLMSLPAARVVAPHGTRTDDHLTTQR